MIRKGTFSISCPTGHHFGLWYLAAHIASGVEQPQRFRFQAQFSRGQPPCGSSAVDDLALASGGKSRTA